MRGKLSAAALAALTGLVLAGCGSSGGGGGAGSSGDPASVTGTLRVVAPNFSADNKGQEVFQGVVDRFHEEYPQVEVEGDFIPYNNLNEKISTALASGDNYDVVMAGVGWVQPLADLGAIESLEDHGYSVDDLEGVPENFIDPVMWEDELYAVPIVANPRLLAYSKSAFEAAGLDPTKPPQSLEELREYAKKLTVRDASGNITQTGFDFWADPSNYRQQFVAFMGALGGREFEDEEPGFNSDAGREALQLIHDMIQVDQSSTYGYMNSAQTALVTTGEAGMGFASPYVDCSEAGIGAKCDDLVYFTLKDQDEIMYSGGRLAGIGAGTDMPEAAAAFIDALRDPASQAAISAMDVGVPLNADAVDPSFFENNPAGQYALDHLDKAVFEYGGATFLDFRAEFGPALDAAILGERPVDDVLAELEQTALGER